MVPLDGSELAECVIPHLQDFIDQGKVESIAFVRVIKPVINTVAIFDDDTAYSQVDWIKIASTQKSSAEDYLKKVVSRLKQNVVEFKTDVLVGRIGDSLIDYINTNDFDLILIASHGRSGLKRWVRGSTADKILSGSCIPVLMIRAPGTIQEVPKKD